MCRDILEWNDCVQVEDLLSRPRPNHIFLRVCLFPRRRQMTLFRQPSVPVMTRTWRSATPDMQVGWVCQVVLALNLVYFSLSFFDLLLRSLSS